MENGIFVNKGFTFALSEYLTYKNNPEGINFNSFYAMIIRTLAMIYDELDIINPYYINSEQTLVTNLIKYGYSSNDVKMFFKAIDSYYVEETSDGFLFIEKALVDMFVKKNMALNIPEMEKAEFRAFIYSPYTSNPLRVSYNYLMCKDPYEILNYYDKKILENTYKAPAKQKETLNFDAYQALNYSIEDIKKMNATELDQVNKKVYSFFNINEDAVNKGYLLDQAVYNHNNPKPTFASSGFMNILFFISILASVGMIVLIITLILL